MESLWKTCGKPVEKEDLPVEKARPLERLVEALWKNP